MRTNEVEVEHFGPYRLDEVIGRGGMGEVFRAYDTRRNRVVAVKRLPREMASDATYRARFQQESALVATLHEPHVIPIHDYGEIEGQLFIDMRLVDGRDLGAVLRSHPMSVPRAVDVISQTADALDAAHAAGLVHRDVKPSNILLVEGPGTTGGGDRGVVYLVDFGIARMLGGPTVTNAGSAVGSVGYMAPERFSGDGWDLRVDVYALACVLHECLVGHRPYPSASLPSAMHAHMNAPPPRPTTERPGLDPRFDEIIAIGLAKNPGDRYPSAGALALAARQLLTVESTLPASRRTDPVTPAPLPTSQPLPRAMPPQHSEQIWVQQPSWPQQPSQPQPQLPAQTRTHVRPQPRPTGQWWPAAPDPVPARPSRRRFLQVAGGVVAVAAVGGGVWGGLRLTGVLRSSGPWVATTGDKVYSSPLVVDGVVYVGSNDAGLYAFDAGTGSLIWKYKAAGPITSSPAIAAGIVYVGSDDKKLHAVRAANGEGVWTVPTGVIHSSPAVVDGLVVVGTRDNTVIAVDAARGGAPRWRFVGGDWFNSSPTIRSGVVVIGCRDHNVYAIDLATGAEKWRHATGSSVDSSAAVTDNTVYIGGDDKQIIALAAATGEPIWSYAALGGVVSSPRPAAGVVYVGSDDTYLYALESDTGRMRWRYRTGGGIRSSPAIDGGVVYVGSEDRSLHAIDAAAGTVRWRFTMPAPVDDSSPTVANGLVYVGCLDGKVYAVDTLTGRGPT